MSSCADALKADLRFQSASALLRLVEAGQLTSEDRLNRYLARIKRFNAGVKTVIYKDVDNARALAKLADRDRAAGTS